MSQSFRALIGHEIGPVIDAIAALRITVFRDFPYLYEGDHAYEARYLGVYRDNPRAVVALAEDGGQVVGAATGLPLADADPEFRAPFAAEAVPPIFYCAESVLLPACRGQGAGHRFFDLREEHARALGFRRAVFCGVVRPADHPARPAGYRPLDGFWRKRGYAPIDGAVTEFPWRDIGDAAETMKPMQFWGRDL